MTDFKLCFIDVETTGLDPRIHDPWEVCYWLEEVPKPITRRLPHSIELADPRALQIGGYWDRSADSNVPITSKHALARTLAGVTLVGANPAFDASMLSKFIGIAPWHYRLIDVCTGAMWVYGWERPRSLIDTATALREDGVDIPEPDHTAEGDVRATRAVYDALVRMQRRVVAA